MVNQLVKAGIIDDVFSLCFGMVEGHGALLLGDAGWSVGGRWAGWLVSCALLQLVGLLQAASRLPVLVPRHDARAHQLAPLLASASPLSPSPCRIDLSPPSNADVSGSVPLQYTSLISSAPLSPPPSRIPPTHQLMCPPTPLQMCQGSYPCSTRR